MNGKDGLAEVANRRQLLDLDLASGVLTSLEYGRRRASKSGEHAIASVPFSQIVRRYKGFYGAPPKEDTSVGIGRRRMEQIGLVEGFVAGSGVLNFRVPRDKYGAVDVFSMRGEQSKIFIKYQDLFRDLMDAVGGIDPRNISVIKK